MHNWFIKDYPLTAGDLALGVTSETLVQNGVRYLVTHLICTKLTFATLTTVRAGYIHYCVRSITAPTTSSTARCRGLSSRSSSPNFSVFHYAEFPEATLASFWLTWVTLPDAFRREEKRVGTLQRHVMQYNGKGALQGQRSTDVIARCFFKLKMISYQSSAHSCVHTLGIP